MSEDKLNKYLRIVNEYDDFEFLLSLIISIAAPTLKNHKTASLITFHRNNRNVNEVWTKYKNKVKKKLNINFFELKKDKDKVAVLFYNKEMLKLSIKDKSNINFLKRFGYNEEMDIYKCLKLLRERYKYMCPHEIGIFLGYPIEDVLTFIDCPNTKCKMIGYWKVYHDVEKAKAIFDRYDSIKNKAIETMINGIKPTDLIIN